MNLAEPWRQGVATGWQASLRLTYAHRAGRTVLAAREQSGPLTVQRPFYPDGPTVCHTYVLHPPAGIVGGDRLALVAAVDSGSHALLTTPGASRFYFSRGRVATLTQDLAVAPGATLEWLPQETLVFDGAHARARTRIDLAGDARVVAAEIVGLGRPALGERYAHGTLDLALELWRNGAPLLLERWRGLDGAPGVGEQAALATLLAAPADDMALACARDVLVRDGMPLAAATLLGDVLVCRALAAHCEPLLNLTRALWSALRPSVVGRQAVAPRIWRT